jgi:protein required for attachment to host cells
VKPKIGAAGTRPCARSLGQQINKETDVKLPHRALVLVADGRKLLLLRNEGDEVQIDLQTEAHDQQASLQDRELKTDLAGQSPAPGGTGLGGGTMGETDYQQQSEDRWAADAADLLRKRALANDFDALLVIAAPKTLGVLRQHYHKEVTARLVGELPKEMADRPIPDIEALITGQGAPPT